MWFQRAQGNTPSWGPLWKNDLWEKLRAGVGEEGEEKGLSEPLGPIWDRPEDDASQLAPEAGESFPSVPVRSFYSQSSNLSE